MESITETNNSRIGIGMGGEGIGLLMKQAQCLFLFDNWMVEIQAKRGSRMEREQLPANRVPLGQSSSSTSFSSLNQFNIENVMLFFSGLWRKKMQ